MEGGAEKPAGVENVVEVQVAGAPEAGGEGELVAGRQVWVRVEAALQDVLVVSCGADGRHFQGVLLDCSKRFLPCDLWNVLTHRSFGCRPSLLMRECICKENFRLISLKKIPEL